KEIVLPFGKRPCRRKSEPVNGEVIDIHEDSLGPPEAILELEKQSTRCRRQRAEEVQVEQQISAARPAEAKEGGIPFDAPTSIVVHGLPYSADRRHQDAQQL